MNVLTSVEEIKVALDFGDEILPVGRLAIRDQAIYFGYEDSFLRHGLEISPFRLPLASGVSTAATPFEGLHGVFDDSLPDGWGRLLFDRLIRSHGRMPGDITPLDRLAHVGQHAMGALTYEPDCSLQEERTPINLDELAHDAREVMEGSATGVLQKLLDLNGSSAGARPKALIGVDANREHLIHGMGSLQHGFEPWIVKFPNTQDGMDAGAIEYVYALMAKQAGITVPEVHLFPAEQGPGYFAVKRFDREGAQRLHMHTAGGLLHSNFRTPSLDYQDLIAVTVKLTRDVRHGEEMFRRAVFNVLAHNRDDHAKNFSYLMDREGQWRLSPAYDVTFSMGPGGEQSTMVMGEGKKPGKVHLIQLGQDAGLSTTKINEVVEQTETALRSWREFAETYGVGRENMRHISDRIDIAGQG